MGRVKFDAVWIDPENNYSMPYNFSKDGKTFFLENTINQFDFRSQSFF